MIRRSDLAKVIEVTGLHGFKFRHASGLDMLQYGATGKAKDAIHLLFSGERVRPSQPYANPVLAPEEVNMRGSRVFVIPVADLVQMKLTTHRLADQVHIKDMDEVGLITPEIERHLPADLYARLQDIKAKE